VSASEDLNEMADVIHDALGDLCCGVEDADPDRVLCFEVAFVQFVVDRFRASLLI
jgi:hypothetical protein